ncbi:MAG: gamma-glutamyltransferase [Castellaniella sp.]
MGHSTKTTSAHRAMVVSGHEAATEAAARCLEQGGSIADAALTGAAALSVALPQACGLGGDAFILAHDAHTGEVLGLNASGFSPALATPAHFADGITPQGAHSGNVPGMVGGWQALHERLGRLPWAEILAPAITLAREGVPASTVLARATALHQALLADDPGSRSLFLPGGAPLTAGAPLVQTALAQTLETIAREGSAAFYRGDIAQRLCATVEARGGLLRADDMAAYAPLWVTPLSVGYQGHRVFAMPPNSYGLYLLLQLMALEDSAGADFAVDAADHETPTDPAVARLLRLIRAAQAAFSVGARAVADPDPRHGTEPAAALLGPQGLARLRKAGAGRPGNRGGTAVISVADHEGNAVIIIQSVYYAFGSGLTDPATGILLNNRLAGFNTEAGHPNAVGPRKRPAHTLCPALVFRDGRLRHALSTPGGPGQTLTLAQVIQALVEDGADLQAAIDAPRWSMGLAGELLAESTLAQATVDGLAGAGSELARAAAGTPFFGSVKGISLEPDGRLIGVADQRRNATARGVD